jgi:hypothetical protein
MKIFLTSIAMAIAAPAFAQAAPPADTHAGHGAKGMSAEQEKHDCCCEKMKAAGKKMECCDRPNAGTPADPHAGHDMSSK